MNVPIRRLDITLNEAKPNPYSETTGITDYWIKRLKSRAAVLKWTENISSRRKTTMRDIAKQEAG